MEVDWTQIAAIVVFSSALALIAIPPVRKAQFDARSAGLTGDDLRDAKIGSRRLTGRLTAIAMAANLAGSGYLIWEGLAMSDDTEISLTAHDRKIRDLEKRIADLENGGGPPGGPGTGDTMQDRIDRVADKVKELEESLASRDAETQEKIDELWREIQALRNPDPGKGGTAIPY